MIWLFQTYMISLIMFFFYIHADAIASTYVCNLINKVTLMVFKNSIHNPCEQHHCRHSNDDNICIPNDKHLCTELVHDKLFSLFLFSMLQVLPKAERRGLGGLLAAAMSREIARGEEITLTAWIVATNWRSEALLKRIGYQKDLVNEWIKLVPNSS